MPENIIKRDGRTVAYEENKIAEAIKRAFEAFAILTGGADNE